MSICAGKLPNFTSNMAQNIVTFHYTLRDSSGHMIDMSIGREPIVYMEGAGRILVALEEQLRGLPAGAKTTVNVPAAQAYGEHNPALLHKVKRSLLPSDGEIKPGDAFRTSPDPRSPVVAVVAVEGDEVTLDANHPLAGRDLVFHVEIVAVREATAEEIAMLAAARHGCGCGCGGGDGDFDCESDCDESKRAACNDGGCDCGCEGRGQAGD